MLAELRPVTGAVFAQRSRDFVPADDVQAPAMHIAIEVDAFGIAPRAAEQNDPASFRRQLKGGRRQCGRPGRFDHHIRAISPQQTAQIIADVIAPAERVIGAKLLSQHQPLLIQVDADHGDAARELRQPHRQDADETRAQNRDRLAQFYARLAQGPASRSP